MNKSTRVVCLILKFIVVTFYCANAQISGSVTAGNWYRIASNSGDRANAEFTLRDFISSGGHSSVTFRAGISFNDQPGISFTLMNHSYYRQVTFTKIRILDKSTYDPQYIEVFVERSGSVNFSVYDNLHNSGWQEVAWSSGSIPTGYTTTEFSINNIFVIGSQGNHLTINREGQIGIGTTTPGAKVDIEGSNELLRLTYGGSFAGYIRGIKDGSNHWFVGAGSASEDNIHLSNYKNAGLILMTNGSQRLNIIGNGNVGIGNTNPTEKLVVDGKILAEEVKVQTVPASDYVFEPDYNLLPLTEVESFIQQNKHLPDIPSAEDFKADGVGLGEMDDMLLRKVEELTLYVIDLKKENEEQAKEIQELKTKLITQ